MKTVSYIEPNTAEAVFEIRMDTNDQFDKERLIIVKAVEKASDEIAKMFVKQYGKRIVKGMSMAEVFKKAKLIAAKELSTKLP